MDASQILAIPLDQPWRLFPDPPGFKDAVRALRKKWALASNYDPKANEVMAHINVLVDKYEQDPSIRVAYLNSQHIPGVGRCVIESERITYWFDDSARDYMSNMLAHTFRYRHSEMITKMSPLLPVFVKGRDREIFIRKKKDELNLADLLASQDGHLPERCVAWILSRLYYIACYLDYSELAHVDISLRSLYVDMKKHTVHLYGGWWYAKRLDEKALGAPRRTVELSVSFGKTGIPTRKLISEQIKQVGCELLGFPSKAAMLDAIMLPKPLIKWLSSPGMDNPVAEFPLWDRCLDQSFGPRKFFKWELSENDVYPNPMKGK